MIETPHYIRFQQTGEVSGFRRGKIDRFATASITLTSPRRKRPPGVPGDACNLAGVTCPKYSTPAAGSLPDASTITHRLYFAKTATKERRKKRKERRKEGNEGVVVPFCAHTNHVFKNEIFEENFSKTNFLGLLSDIS
jgi:hypothetical protein